MHGLIGGKSKAKSPEILEWGELTEEQVRETPRAPSGRVKKLRDSHHMVARLVALGLTNIEVAERTGYSYNGISILRQDPAFQELVANYREALDERALDDGSEYWRSLVKARNMVIRQQLDRLEDADENPIPLNQLIALGSDLADRTGYPKRKESVNVNIDLADRLDAAVRRIREAKQISSGSATVLPLPTMPHEAGSLETNSVRHGADRGTLASADRQLSSAPALLGSPDLFEDRR